MISTDSSAGPGSVDVRVHPPSGTIVLNRPQAGNALSRSMLDQLLQALDDLHRQLSVRAVIITGAGSSFCEGLDVGEIRQRASEKDPQAGWGHDAQRWHQVVETMLRFPKPILAAVNGPASAAGASLLLAADLVVATPEATLDVPEPRWGLVAGLAVPLLAFRLGASVAANLLLRATTAHATDLRRLGLYHDLVESNQVWARAHQWAREITELAPQSLALTKRLLNEEVGQQLMTLLAVGAAASATACTTEAALEGMDAFLQQRPPRWPGYENG